MRRPRRGRSPSAALHRRRRRAKEARALRRERLKSGIEAVLEEERAIIGASYLEPGMIESIARERPRAWWVHDGEYRVFRALYMKWRHYARNDVEGMIRDLESRGLREVAADIRERVAPCPALRAVRAWLAELRRRLGPIDEDPIVGCAKTLLDAEPEADAPDESAGSRRPDSPPAMPCLFGAGPTQLLLFPAESGSSTSPTPDMH